MNTKNQDPALERLWQEAISAQKNSYSPYSKYAVGAAIQCGEKIFSGCNVENASFGGTICAERTALVKAISEGERRIDRVMIVTAGGAGPCGICSQVLSEFCEPDTEVWLATPQEIKKCWRLKELYPLAFLGAELKI